MCWRPALKVTRQIHFDNEWHGSIVCHALDETRPFIKGFDRMISITSEGKLLGGVLYDNYRIRSIQMHMASFATNWGTRDMMWVCFDYPFNLLGVERIFAEVPSTNEHALQLDRRLGFVDHCVKRNAVPGGDLVVLSMDRHQCRWLNLRPRSIQRKVD